MSAYDPKRTTVGTRNFVSEIRTRIPDIRGVLVALIIIIVVFAVGMGGYFLR